MNKIVGGLVLASVLSMINIPSAIATCTVAGTTATCSGVKDASNTLNVFEDDIDTVNISAALTDTSPTGTYLSISNRDTGGTPLSMDRDLTINVESGTNYVGATSVAGQRMLTLDYADRTDNSQINGNIEINVAAGASITAGPQRADEAFRLFVHDLVGDINFNFAGNYTVPLALNQQQSLIYSDIFSQQGNTIYTMTEGLITLGSNTAPVLNTQGFFAQRYGSNDDGYITAVNLNGGTIETHGASAHGAYIRHRVGTSADVRIILDGTDIDITQTNAAANLVSYGLFLLADSSATRSDLDLEINSGSITVDSLAGIDASATGALLLNQVSGTSTATMTGGTVTVNNRADGGAALTAIHSYQGGETDIIFDLSGGTLNFINVKDSNDDFATGSGVRASHSGTGTITFSQTGSHTIAVQGDNADGVALTHTGDSGSIFGRFGATITAPGLDSDGVNVTATNADYILSVDSTGSITGGGGDGAAIGISAANGGIVSIDAGGVVDGSASGVVIIDRDIDTTLDGNVDTGGVLSVFTSGTINGDVVLGFNDDFISLSDGQINGDIYADDVTSFNSGVSEPGTAGDDLFIWSGGTLNGNFYGQDGSDTVVITGSPNITGNEVIDGGDDLSDADGFIDRLIFQDIDYTANIDQFLNFEDIIVDGGTIAFSNPAVTAVRTTVTNGGVLDAGTSFTLNSDLITNNLGVFEGAGGGNGSYNINGNVTNDGIIQTRDGAVGDVVNISGDYTGSGLFDTDVNTDTNGSDRLVVAGSTSGSSVIRPNDIGSGIGQITGTGAGVGIPVVAVGGTSADTDFSLEGGELLVGAFRYTLNRETDGNFYLQSEVLPQVEAMRAAPAVMRSTVTTVPTFSLRQSGRSLLSNQLGTLQERIGDCQVGDNLENPVADDCQDMYSWVRVSASRLDLNTPDLGSYSLTENSSFIHFGHDIELPGGSEDHVWFAGINVNVGDGDVDVDAPGNDRTLESSIDKDYSGLGLSATYFNKQEAYVDFIVQYTDHDSTVSSERGTTDINGDNLALSVEAGKRFRPWASRQDLALIPQAQLIVSRADFDSFVDADGVEYSVDDGDTTLARIGLMLEKSNVADPAQGNENNSARDATGYIIANLYQNLDNKTSIIASGTQFEYRDHDTWGGIGVGGTLQLQESVQLYGEVSYEQSLDDFGDSDLVSGSIGVRKTW